MRRVTLPLAWPGILAAAIYIFTIGFAAFDVPAIIGWGNRIFTFTTYLVNELLIRQMACRLMASPPRSDRDDALAGALSWWYGAMHCRSRRFPASPAGLSARDLRGSASGALGLGLHRPLPHAGKVMPIAVTVWAALLPFFQLPSSPSHWPSVSLSHYSTLALGARALSALRNTLFLTVSTPTLTLALSRRVLLDRAALETAGPRHLRFHRLPAARDADIVFGVGVLLFVFYAIQRVVPLYGTVSCCFSSSSSRGFPTPRA